MKPKVKRPPPTPEDQRRIDELKKKHEIDPEVARKTLEEYQEEERRKAKELFGDKTPFPIPHADEDP